MQAPAFDRIATRTFSFTNSDGTPGLAYLDFSAPGIYVWDDGTTGWCCQFRTRGFGDELSNTAFGFDGVRALHMAMSMAATMLAFVPAAVASDYGMIPNFGLPTIPAPPPGFTIPPEFQYIFAGDGGGDNGDNGGDGPRLSPV